MWAQSPPYRIKSEYNEEISNICEQFKSKINRLRKQGVVYSVLFYVKFFFKEFFSVSKIHRSRTCVLISEHKYINGVGTHIFSLLTLNENENEDELKKKSLERKSFRFCWAYACEKNFWLVHTLLFTLVLHTKFRLAI